MLCKEGIQLHNLLACKGKRNVRKTYLTIFTMFLFLLSPSFSMQSYDTVFVEEQPQTGEDDGTDIRDENGEAMTPEVDITHHGIPIDTGMIYEFTEDVGPDS